MFYTAPDLAFAKIEPHMGELVRLYDNGDIQVSAEYDGEGVTIYAEDDISMLSEMNCIADPEDVALAVSAVYAENGISTDIYEDDFEEIPERTEEMMVEQAENEYDMLFDSLMYEILPHDAPSIPDAAVQECKNAVLGILGFKYGMPVHRPAFIPDGKGGTVFTRYPYRDYKPQKK